MSEESESAPQQEKSARTAAQRRAEIRRRKLLLNSEDRMNKIVGFSKSDADSSADRCELICIVLRSCRNALRIIMIVLLIPKKKI